MSDLSRRTLARGAAWTLPAAAAAVAAPAFAASSDVVVRTCDQLASIIQLQGGSTRPAITQNLIPDRNVASGAKLGISMGIWNIPSARTYVTTTGRRITGFYALPGWCGTSDCSVATVPSPMFQNAVTNAEGTSYAGAVVSNTPYRCSPQTAGAGLSMDITIATEMPYDVSTGGCFPERNPVSNPVRIAVPYSIIPVNGTTPVSLAGGPATPCCLTFSATFEADGGCMPRRATSYGWSA